MQVYTDSVVDVLKNTDDRRIVNLPASGKVDICAWAKSVAADHKLSVRAFSSEERPHRQFE